MTEPTHLSRSLACAHCDKGMSDKDMIEVFKVDRVEISMGVVHKDCEADFIRHLRTLIYL